MAHPAERRLRLRTGDMAARSFQDETVILDMRKSTYMSTNPSGTVLWRALEDGATRSRLIEVLLEEFDVTEERAAADVDAFVAECERRGLLSGESGEESA